MVEERWVMCGEFFLFLAEDLGESTAGKIIQEGCA